MTEPVAASKSVARRLRATLLPWEQHPGERDIWWSRFIRYVALGPTRSVSLVATGERNHYPVPAHWPMVAKQSSWKVRAEAFDRAAKADPSLLNAFNSTIWMDAKQKAKGDEALKFEGLAYTIPPDDGYEDEPASSVS